MKGGGIVLLVIFVFLFICFMWGVFSVIGSIRDAIPSRRAIPKTNPSTQPTPTFVPEPTPGSPIHGDAVPQPSEQSIMAYTLEHLQQIHELHKSGALTDTEFVQIKARLIQNIHPA